MTVEQWLGKDNEIGRDIWYKKYQKYNESFDEWVDRIADGDNEIKRLILDKKFLPGGRIMSNIGLKNDKSTTSNCFSRGFIEDDYGDIMQAAVDIGKTFKAQGGQGLSLSKLRPKGTPIGDKYTSDGIVPFMKIYNEVTEGTSQGGCIAEDELVLTDKGYKKIKDICVGDNVFTKKGFKKVLTVWDKGEQETFKVTTEKGYSITTTIDHKYCVDGFSVTPLKDLKIGDKINLITKNADIKDNGFDEQAYFLANFMANGYINPQDNTGTITLYKDYTEIGDRLIRFLKSKGFEAYYNNRKEENAIRVVLTVPACNWINSVVAKDKCYDIEVPQYIFESDDNVVLSYLVGALDSDGCLKGNHFSYSTVCEKYAQQICLLMSRVGFFPSINIEERKQYPNKQPLYVVSDRIRNNVDLSWSYKVSFKGISPAVKNSRYTTPYTMENTGLISKDAKHLQKISKKDLIGLFTYLETKDKAPFAPMIFDKIEKIENVGVKHVYDIEVEDEHKFFCNGFYVSNSRKGALLMSLDAWHKEAMNFITIKSKDGLIEKANLSLEIDDEFMSAVEKYYTTGEKITVHRKQDYSGHIVEWDVTPIDVFEKMIANANDWGDPGCLFVNRFRNYNIMEFSENYQIETCNPCGFC